jgi:hypothetical protein
MKRYIIIGALLVSAITSCTSYKPAGFGGGYSDLMIAPDTAHVRFQGSDMSSSQRVGELLLKRCADVTLQHGFRYFSAENWADESSTESITFPGSVDSTGSVSGNSFSAYSSEHTVVRPPSTLNLNRPAGGVTIKMGNDQSALAAMTGHRVFDASFVFAQIH